MVQEAIATPCRFMQQSQTLSNQAMHGIFVALAILLLSSLFPTAAVLSQDQPCQRHQVILEGRAEHIRVQYTFRQVEGCGGYDGRWVLVFLDEFAKSGGKPLVLRGRTSTGKWSLVNDGRTVHWHYVQLVKRLFVTVRDGKVFSFDGAQTGEIHGTRMIFRPTQDNPLPAQKMGVWPIELQGEIQPYTEDDDTEDDDHCLDQLVQEVPPIMRAAAQEAIPRIISAAKTAGITDQAQLAYILATAQRESLMGRNMFEQCRLCKNEQAYYITWLLEQCSEAQALDELITDSAMDLLVERLSTPLQIAYYLTRAFEEGYRVGQKPITPEVIDTALVKDLNDLEPRLTRHGYTVKALAEVLNVRPREIRSFLQGRLPPSRTQELQHEMLAVGIPL